MKDLRLALAQIAPKLGDLAANLDLHVERIAAARAAGAALVVFPELSLTGYHLADQVPEVALTCDAEFLRTLAGETHDVDVVVGFVEEAEDSRFYNSAAYFSDGRLLHLHRKLYLPTYGMFQEGREFARGEVLRAFRTRFGPAGLLVCEDLWHATSSWLLTQQGAEIVITIGNGPTRGTRPGAGITSLDVWRRLLRGNGQFLTSYFAFVNRVGCEDGLTFGGGSVVVDPFGRIVGELPALDEAMETFQLSAETLRRARASYPLLRDTNLDLVQRELERLRRLRFDLPEPTHRADGRPDPVPFEPEAGDP